MNVVSGRLRLATFGALYAAVTLLYAWPLVFSIGSGLPHDTGDPALNTWILWWNSRAVPFTEHWWNAPIFHPSPGSLALSETLLSMSLVTSPLQWLGASAIVAHNVAFLLSFPAAALAMHALVRHLTGRHDAAVLAGLAFGFHPYRAAQMPHLQMEWSAWLPLCLLALHRYVDPSKKGSGLASLGLAAACWTLNGFTNGYFLVYFGILVGFWMLWFVRSSRELTLVAIAFVVGSVPLVPMLVGHSHYQSMFGLARDPLEIAGFSADLSAIWAASRLALARYWTLYPDAEGELYPGAIVLGLAIGGAVVAWHRRRASGRLRTALYGIAAFLVIGTFVFQTSGGWPFNALGVRLSLRRAPLVLTLSSILLATLLVTDARIKDAWHRRSATFFYAIAAVLMLLFALGPEARVFDAPFWSSAPYGWLMELPGGRALRVPARFATMMILCVVVAAGLGWRHLVANGARVAVTVAVAVLILVDGWVPTFPVAAVPPMVTLTAVPANVPLLELPLRTLYSETSAELRATEHGHPLVNGFSGYEPPHYGPLREGLQTGDAAVFTGLQRFGPLVVLVNRDDDPSGSHEDFVRTTPGARQLYRTPVGPVFSLPGMAPRPDPRAGTELDIVAVVDRWRQDAVAAIKDGDLETRWQSDAPQFVGDTLALRFGRPVIASHLELSLGPYPQNYPRHLRITAEDSDSTLLWEGRTAGDTVVAAVKSPKVVPLTIHLDRQVRTTGLLLTILEDVPDAYWSVSEARAFGLP